MCLCFRAFVKANRSNKDIMIPDLNLTANQLFWVGYAQTECLLSDYEYSPTFGEILKYEVLFSFIQSLIHYYYKMFRDLHMPPVRGG